MLIPNGFNIVIFYMIQRINVLQMCPFLVINITHTNKKTLLGKGSERFKKQCLRQRVSRMTAKIDVE